MRSDYPTLKFSLLIFFWLWFLLLTGATWVFGYVIEGPKILQLSAREIGRADSLRVDQKLTTYFFDKGTRTVKADQMIRYLFPDIFRIDQTADGVHQFYLAQGDQSITVVNNQVNQDAESEMDLYHHLLLQHRSAALITFLEAYGIDTTISSLGKFEKKPAFVIGARFPDENQSQLWIDKESHLPMRWLLVVLTQTSPSETGNTEPDPILDAPAQSDPYQTIPSQSQPVQSESGRGKITFERLEFRFFFWRKIKQLQYPMKTTVLRNGVLLREIRVNDLEADSNIDRTLMSLDQQKALFPEKKSPPVEQQQYESTDDIQKTIDHFKKKFE